MEDITDSYHKSVRRICKNSEIKLNLYNQSNALLLADVIENVWDMYLKICWLDSTNFFSVPGLSWKTALKRINVKLELNWYVNNGRKRYERWNYHFIHQYVKANIKYMTNYRKKPVVF